MIVQDITWKEACKMTKELIRKPAGDWTHLIGEECVRLEGRYRFPDNRIKVIFRTKHCVGVWNEEEFNKEATPKTDEQAVQLTLF